MPTLLHCGWSYVAEPGLGCGREGRIGVRLGGEELVAVC